MHGLSPPVKVLLVLSLLLIVATLIQISPSSDCVLRHSCAVHKVISAETTLLQLNTENSFNGRRYAFSHHKTGTVLAYHLIEYGNSRASEYITGGYLFLEFGKLRAIPHTVNIPKIMDAIFCPCSRLVHFIRDPVEVAVSAYLYHRSGAFQDNEAWLHTQGPYAPYAKWMGNVTADTLVDYLMKRSNGNKPTEDALAHLNQTQNNAIPHNANITLSWYDFLQIVPPLVGLKAEIELNSFANFPAMEEMTLLINEAYASSPSAASCIESENLEVPLRSCNATSSAWSNKSVLQVGLENFFVNYTGTVETVARFLEFKETDVSFIIHKMASHDVSSMSARKRAANGHITAGLYEHERLLLRSQAELLMTPLMLNLRRTLGYI